MMAGSPPDPVLEYVQARAQQERVPFSVEVTITATIPSIKKVGTLRATRTQAAPGLFNYQAMAFEGDKLIKTNVIARYLSAELEAQRPEEKLATQISPLNYRFKLKDRKQLEGREVLVYEVKPHKRRPGLFQGQVWIDSETRQPLMETGKLTKLPSVWVKEITFTREYTQVNGIAVPLRIVSEVKTRIVGKAQITVEFDNYRFNAEPALQPVTVLGVLPDAPLPAANPGLAGAGSAPSSVN